MWVIASLPFWVAGLGFFLLGTAGIIFGFSYEGLAKPRMEWIKVMSAAVSVEVVAGALLFIAAKIAA